MGLSGIGPGSLLLIILLVIVLFGSKRIRNLGGDVASAIKSFRQGLNRDPQVQDNKKESDEDNR